MDKDRCRCSTPHLTEHEIEKAFVKAENSLISDRLHVMEAMEKATMKEYSPSSKEHEYASLNQELELVGELMKKSLDKPVLSSSGEGSSEFDSLAERYASLKKRRDDIETEINERKRRQGALRAFYNELARQPELITEFDSLMFSILVDHATVTPDKRIVFTFKDGRTA